MNILNPFNFFGKSDNRQKIKHLLILLSKITQRIPHQNATTIKAEILTLNKDITALNQKLSSENQTSDYLKITKGLSDISALLENLSFEISFHKIDLNMPIKTLLLNLEKVLILLSKLIAINKQPHKTSDLNIEIKQIFSQAIKEIKLAKTGISNETDNFIENLKFSSIYNRMEPCFIATDDINEAILSLTN
jgi:hypothetical protein